MDRREALTTMALAGAAFTLPAGARPARAETHFGWTEIRPGFHASVNVKPGGNLLVASSKGRGVLIDSKFAPTSAILKREAGDLGGEITLINTHHHADHTSGNVTFDRIVAQTKARDRVLSQVVRYRGEMRRGVSELPDTFRAEARPYLSAPDEAWAPNITFESSLRLHAPGPVVECTHIGPGHTDNDIIVHFPEDNVIHAGDLVFHGLHSYFDPEGGYDTVGWVRSVETLIEMCDAETVVVPGHGEICDRDGVRRQHDYLASLLEEVGKLVRQGVSKEEAQTRTWPFMDGLGFEQVRPRAIGAVHDEIVARSSRD